MMNPKMNRYRILKLIRAIALICIVLVFLLHQVPTNTTEAQSQTTEIDICLEYGPGCSVQWHPVGGGLLIRTVDRLTYYSVDWDEIWFTYIHEGARIDTWRPDGRAFATASIRTLQVRSAYHGDISYLDVFEEINFSDYMQDLYENEGLDVRYDPIMVSWHPDGTKLAFLHNYVSIWDIDANTITPIRSLGYLFDGEGYLLALAWSPDGTQMALSSPYRFILMDTTTNEVVLQSIYPEGYEWGAFEWNPNGQQVAIGLSRFGRPYDPAQVIVMNTETGGIDTTYSTEARFIGSVAWSNNGRYLAAGTNSVERPYDQHGFVENALRIWNVETGELAEILTYELSVGSVDWRPDESQVAFTVGRQIHILDFDGE